MDTHLIATAERCLSGSHDGTLDFPTIVGTLLEAGFEGYGVDYRRGQATYYRPDGTWVDLALNGTGEAIAARFDAGEVERAVRAAQAKAEGYTYAAFCATVKAAGCAGYMVSFPGRRVVYFGRTAETHVEHFPN